MSSANTCCNKKDALKITIYDNGHLFKTVNQQAIFFFDLPFGFQGNVNAEAKIAMNTSSFKRKAIILICCRFNLTE